MELVERKPLLCKNCGGRIDRVTMKCPYCDTQYERPHEGVPVLPVVERRGVERIYAAIAVDDECLVRNPHLRDNIPKDVLVSLARRLLDYATITVKDDPCSFRKIINAAIAVVPPKKGEDDGQSKNVWDE